MIDDGEIVCIIGASGAGMSTTLRAVSRMVKTARPVSARSSRMCVIWMAPPSGGTGELLS
jgi:ABC-type phosphate/phosphonate transport system ATPase subunit